MTTVTCSAGETRDAISTNPEDVGLAPAYRIGQPARVAPPTVDGHNWHFIDILRGNVKEVAMVTSALSDASCKYILVDQ
ncbi:hypothetical protein PQQ64_20750 [Paraburkholderia graminis]|uniref:hypothetical protein n=1 Tax=Paraburkholderia graminis TaxID=60548 RepID=UPI0038BE12FC